MIQLEFDIEQSQIDKVKRLADLTYDRVENVRKGIFKKHSLLVKDVALLQEEVILLKNQIDLIKEYFKYQQDLKD